MLENIRLSFQGIWAHWLRSFLTMLGIIIGIAAIVKPIKVKDRVIKKEYVYLDKNTKIALSKTLEIYPFLNKKSYIKYI